ncbi:hypothetical protein HDK77DRAFT_454130 [Phyllosticta capitalensis]|uniref:Uncharacterized protein n=1 Tax=Phyllosticta capitalensis TaxID=121624 RepID=A0ABR1YCJ7_9PEZI
MRFSTFAFGGLLALAQLAVAADEPLPKPNSTELSSTLTSTSLSPTASCIAACDVGDVDCQAKCVGTAHPNSAQANQTTECAAKCNQGDGSPKAVQEYADCQQSCINSYFPIGSAPGVQATGTGANTAASASATATGTETSGAKETGANASKSGTASGAKSSSTGAANSNYAYSASMVGLGSLFMGLLTL